MRLLYLAHPVSGGRFHTAKAWLRALNLYFNPRGTVVTCPWLPQVEITEDSGEARAFWLQVDVDLVRRLDGVVAVGREVTAGMQEELDAVARFLALA